MATPSIPIEGTAKYEVSELYGSAYRAFAYFGLFSIAGSLAFGYRFSPQGAVANYAWNAGLYALFILPHLVMTRSWWKHAVWGHPAGHPRERRFYIFMTVVTWLGVLAFHRPAPGVALDLPVWMSFVGTVVFLLGFMLFFEGITREALDGLLGVPGTVSAFSHGPETPLFTEGAYASVRHPMYRAFFVQALGSLLMHPNTAQLFWALLLCGTFVAFIPIEERQLIRARGEDYIKYQKKTPYRLFRGIW